MRTKTLLMALCLWVGIGSAPSIGSVEESWSEFTFSKMNDTYYRSGVDVEWSSDGPVSMTLSSPEHQLSILEHQLRLRPLQDGVFESRTRVRFEGQGDLLAKIDALGSAGNLGDHVVIPEQEVEVEGKLRFFFLPDGEVRVVTVWLPKTVSLRIESGLGQQLFGVCNIALSIFGVDCSLLERVFTTAIVPLPEPGSSTTLTLEQMTAEEGVRLREYLSVTGAGSSIQSPLP